MSVHVIRESRFPQTAAHRGRLLTEAIWRDMTAHDGRLHHELLVDDDDPGHLLVISRWTSRERADAAVAVYATHPDAVAVNGLVAEPRRRIVATTA